MSKEAHHGSFTASDATWSVHVPWSNTQWYLMQLLLIGYLMLNIVIPRAPPSSSCSRHPGSNCQRAFTPHLSPLSSKNAPLLE